MNQIVSSSRIRSLARDVARGLGQQMFFWGCDVRHPEGCLLTRLDMERLARAEKGGEGSSRYRMEWQGGVVELHSYCVGWYASEAPGVLFIRSLERITSCCGPQPFTPGRYEPERMIFPATDELLTSVKPLIEWILFYESRIRQLAGSAYREECWRRHLAKMGARPWLPPGEAEAWFHSFLQNPQRTSRPRDFFRSARPQQRPARLNTNRHFPF